MASIQKRPDGTYRARYRDGANKEHARHFKRKVDAQRWLDEVTASVVTGTYVDPQAGSLTFAAFFEDWASRQVWEPGTLRHMSLIARSVPFSDMPLKAIRGSHVELWVKSMHSDGLAPLTIANRFTALRTILRAAVRDRRIPSDPTADVARAPKKPSSRQRRPEIPTPEQVAAIFAASDPRMRAFVAVCAFAGLRLGEASAVNRDSVDFLRRTLSVTRQVQRVPGAPAATKPPKYGSVRDVFIPDELCQVLSEHLAEYGTAADGWLFYTVDGAPLPPTTVNSWWLRTTRAAGCSGVHLHALRHFFASGLIAAGCDVVTVQRALGHAKPSMTLDTYSHLWPSAEDRTRQASSGLLRNVLASADSLRTEHAD